MSDGYRRPEEVARHIAEMCTKLREMARGAGLSFLVHLLSMVIVQAETHHHGDEQELRGRVSDSVE